MMEQQIVFWALWRSLGVGQGSLGPALGGWDPPFHLGGSGTPPTFSPYCQVIYIEAPSARNCFGPSKTRQNSFWGTFELSDVKEIPENVPSVRGDHQYKWKDKMRSKWINLGKSLECRCQFQVAKSWPYFFISACHSCSRRCCKTTGACKRYANNHKPFAH